MKKHIVCIFVILIVSFLLYSCINKEEEEEDCGCTTTQNKEGLDFKFANQSEESFFPEYTVNVPPLVSNSPYYDQIQPQQQPEPLPPPKEKESFFPEYTVDVPKMISSSPFYKNINILPIQSQEPKANVKESKEGFFNEQIDSYNLYPMKSSNVYYGDISSA